MSLCSDKVQRCLSHSTSGSGATISGCLSTWRGRTLRTRREGSTPKHRISTSPSPVPLCFYSSAMYLKGTTRMLLFSITVLYTFVLFKQTDTRLVALVSFIFASVVQTLLSDVLMHLQFPADQTTTCVAQTHLTVGDVNSTVRRSQNDLGKCYNAFRAK